MYQFCNSRFSRIMQNNLFSFALLRNQIYQNSSLCSLWIQELHLNQYGTLFLTLDDNLGQNKLAKKGPIFLKLIFFFNF